MNNLIGSNSANSAKNRFSQTVSPSHMKRLKANLNVNVVNFDHQKHPAMR